MYSHGQGTSQNYIQAYAWYKIAADQGDVAAQDMLSDFEVLLNNDERKEAESLARELHKKNIPH